MTTQRHFAVAELNNIFTAVELEMASRSIEFNVRHDDYAGDRETATWWEVRHLVDSNKLRDVNDKAELGEDVYDYIDSRLEDAPEVFQPTK